MNAKLRKFIKAYENCGDVPEACLIAGLSLDEYTKEYRENETFKVVVDEILKMSEALLDYRMRSIAKKKILEMLEHGVKVKKAINKWVKDPDGEIIKSEHSIEESHMPCPMYVLQYVLKSQESNDVISAVKWLASENLLPSEKVTQILQAIEEPKARIREILGEQTSTERHEIDRSRIAQAQAELLGVSIDRIN